MIDLRRRLIDIGITGYVEQQEILQEISWWISEIQKENLKDTEITYDSQVIIDRFLNRIKASLNANQATREEEKNET